MSSPFVLATYNRLLAESQQGLEPESDDELGRVMRFTTVSELQSMTAMSLDELLAQYSLLNALAYAKPDG
jgi:hypothetical protein